MRTVTDLEQRLGFLRLGPDDVRYLADLKPVLEEHASELVAAFYRHLLSFPPTRRLLHDPEVKNRLVEKQREYLLSLAGPTLDDDYVEARRRMGETHARIGLEPRWYLSAYALYFSLLLPLICEVHHEDPERSIGTVNALQKLLVLDAQLAMESYIDDQQRQLEFLTEELAEQGRLLARDYEQKKMELRHTEDRARAAESLASVATLVAGLAHEIGTPMGVIQGHAKLLEPAISGEDALWRLRTIQEQVSRISKIIQTLLNIARPGKTRHVPVEIEPLITSTLSFIQEKCANRGVRTECISEAVPSVLGDPERLQQLFLNLFLNAVDFMEDGGELQVAIDRSSDGEVRVRVRDTGRGIPDADLERIFEPFFTSKDAGEGNGLGLMVAKSIVTDHGGSISASSRVGSWTEFEILLPGATS